MIDTKACVEACPPNYFLSGTNCEPCHAYCSTCISGGNGSCSACRATYALDQATAQCLTSCGSNQYMGVQAPHPLYCIDCSTQNCSTCQLVNSQVDCQTCQPTFYLRTTDSKCITPASCASPLVLVETPVKLCASCHQNCATCNGITDTSCLTCPISPTARYLKPDTSECLL